MHLLSSWLRFYTAYILIAERTQGLFSLTPSLYVMKEVDLIKKSAGNHLHPHLLTLICPLNKTAHYELITQSKHYWIQALNLSFSVFVWVRAHECGRTSTCSIFISFEYLLTLSCRGNTGEDGGWRRWLHIWTLACFCTHQSFFFFIFPVWCRIKLFLSTKSHKTANGKVVPMTTMISNHGLGTATVGFNWSDTNTYSWQDV